MIRPVGIEPVAINLRPVNRCYGHLRSARIERDNIAELEWNFVWHGCSPSPQHRKTLAANSNGATMFNWEAFVNILNDFAVMVLQTVHPCVLFFGAVIALAILGRLLGIRGGGSGYSGSEASGNRQCSMCHGTGNNIMACGYCHGSGFKNGKSCGLCNGRRFHQCPMCRGTGVTS
jgi:hypothetical protein